MARPRTVGTLLKTAFVDATRHEMEAAYDIKFGHTPAPSLSDDELRAELVKAFTPGETGHVGTARPLAHQRTPDAPINHGTRGRIPNLAPTGRWDGRMRRVTFLQQDGSPKQEVQPVGWDGVIWNIPLNTPVDMPWPYWEAAQQTAVRDEGSDAVTKWVSTPDGRLEKHVTPSVKPTVRWIDHGDVPGTEDLPTSYFDFFRREAQRTHCFAGMNRPALVMVYNKLHEAQPMWYFRDMRDEDIRMKIAMTLGTDIEAILQDELYVEAG